MTPPRKPPPATTAYLESGSVVPNATAAARDGEPWVTSATEYDCVLLVGFGGPEGQDDVIPYLENVTYGRGIPTERLESVATHYRAFGGKSPINAQTAALRGALAEALDVPVYWGNRNWTPMLTETLIEVAKAGHRRVLAVTTSAYSSYSSCRQYREDLADCLAAAGLSNVLQVDKVRPYFDHPGFLAPFVRNLTTAHAQLRAKHPQQWPIEVLFSTHSIPVSMADSSGAPEVGWGPGGAYVAQHLAAMQAIMASSGVAAEAKLVYQSRSGPPHVPWLEPDVNDAITDAAERGVKGIILIPLGFLTDHMEVLWDLDTEASATAADLDLELARLPTPGTDPQFVAALVDLVTERMTARPQNQRARGTALSLPADICRSNCCPNLRAQRPAIAGVVGKNR
jgi:protoporphyrin/coproporphyrin ferrochelatase